MMQYSGLKSGIPVTLDHLKMIGNRQMLLSQKLFKMNRNKYVINLLFIPYLYIEWTEQGDISMSPSAFKADLTNVIWPVRNQILVSYVGIFRL